MAQAAVDLALEVDADGTTLDEATLTVAAAVSEDLVNALIDGIRKFGIAYIRAPYEADGQLVYCSLQHPDDSHRSHMRRRPPRGGGRPRSHVHHRPRLEQPALLFV